MLKLRLRNILRVLLSPLILPWYIRRITKLEVVRAKKPVENRYGAYCDRYFYELGDQVDVCISLPCAKVMVHVEKAVAPYNFIGKAQFEVDSGPQHTSTDPAVHGCSWKKSLSFHLDDDFEEGYYRLRIAGDELEQCVTFIVGDTSKLSRVIVLAPVTTWVAYNEWGGKSVYKNYVDNQDVYALSTQRPNDALTYHPTHNTHDMPIEINIFNWFKLNEGASILPDYYLEQHPELFDSSKLLVLSYHAEYFSKKMYNRLRQLVDGGRSLINLGANQLYWKVRWSTDFQTLHCRKNMTFFKSPLEMGGRWSYSKKPEGAFLGVRFTNSGMGTYAPYQVVDPDHWLFSGLNLEKGQHFGLKGINALPVCGDETDKKSLFAVETECIAKGMNARSAKSEYDVFDGSTRWNGSGGGELTLCHKSSNHAVLSTGAIQSGAGLGPDKVFTQVIRNFIDRFLN